MLFEQLKAQKDFTPSEKAIADAIINGTVNIGMLSTSELAQATHTSKATVTRLCQKLNVPSYRSFQQMIEREQAINHNLQQRLSECPIGRDTGYEDILRILPAFYDNALMETSVRLEKQTLLRVMQRIRKAKKVDIYGAGVTQSIAQLASFKFSTLGIECGTYSGLNEHAILADRHPEEKVIVMLSLTGGNPTMLHIAQWLRGQNYYIIGIGGASKPDLMKLCNDYITVPQGQNVLGMEIIESFTAINYVIDILFSMLLAKDYDHNRDVAEQLLRNMD